MENFLLLIGYLLYSILGFSLTIGIIDPRISWGKTLQIGLLSGIADFLVKEIVVPTYNLPDGVHIITGIIFIALICYNRLKLKLGISFGVSIFNYILAAITETPVLLILLQILGKETFVALSKNKLTVFYMGVISMIPMLVGIIYIKYKKKQYFDSQVINSFYRM